ncbi:MAG: VWA domain-containing protein [Verrucomicrobiae bacterium]|nr:VWA domain-containing protein [Verrucomicrobiae bacterium]
MTKIEFTYSFWIIAAAVLLWLGAGALCFENWRRRRSVKGSAALESMRFFIMTLIGFTLLKPEYVKHVTRQEKPQIVILCDSSESMTTRDVLNTNKQVMTRTEWVVQQKTNRFWNKWEKGNNVILQNFSAPRSIKTTAQPNPVSPYTNLDLTAESGTDINSALEEILKQYNNLRAVVLLSDGDWNTGLPPTSAAMKYIQRSTPIYSVAVGSETPLPDVIVEPVKAQSYGLLGELLAIPVRVKNYLPNEVKTFIQLYDNNVPEMRKEILIPSFGEIQQTLLWQPKTVGDHVLQVEVPPIEGEYLKDNNARQFRITVRTEKLNVLVIDTLPRWEYRYLRNALMRDPGVDVHTLLLHPGMSPGGGSNYLASFPENKEDLSKYDVVFVGDIGISEGELTKTQTELLKGLVEQQGSGLVFLPGWRGRQLNLVNSPLGELLPIIYDETKPNGIGFSTESYLQLTSVGKGHFLTMLTSDPDKNEDLWKTLPGFYWSAGVLKSRPGSEVLAVHSGLRNEFGRIPLLVTRPFGNGETLFMGTDSAWRWRRGVEDKYHYRFWGQVVRWMSHKRHLAAGKGIRLVYSPENPTAGDTLFVYATVMDEKGMPLEKGTIRLSTISQTGKTEHYELSSTSGGWGVFSGNITVKEPGTYKFRLGADRLKEPFETTVIVSSEKREKIGNPANTAILREISELTGGKCVSIDNFTSIVDQIAILPEPKPYEIRIKLWANPYWAGFIILMLGVYWTGRKLAGMI